MFKQEVEVEEEEEVEVVVVEVGGTTVWIVALEDVQPLYLFGCSSSQAAYSLLVLPGSPILDTPSAQPTLTQVIVLFNQK